MIVHYRRISYVYTVAVTGILVHSPFIFPTMVAIRFVLPMSPSSNPPSGSPRCFSFILPRLPLGRAVAPSCAEVLSTTL